MGKPSAVFGTESDIKCCPTFLLYSTPSTKRDTLLNTLHAYKGGSFLVGKPFMYAIHEGLDTCLLLERMFPA